MATKPRKSNKVTDAIAAKSLDRKDGFGEEFKPLPHQIKFFKSRHKYRAMVSGVGGGKTSMGVRESIKMSQAFPGSLGLIGRLTSTSLKDTTRRRFFEICPPGLIHKWNQTDNHLLLKTPVDGVYSEILFRHLDEAGPLGSLDLDWWWIDEAHEPDGDEVPEPTYRMLRARLRGMVGPLRGWITSNSGGKDWIWRHFFSPAKDPACWGMTVSTKENPYLPPGYVEELTRNNPKHWVDRFLDASFEVFEGQIFTEFRDKHEGDEYAHTLDEAYQCHVYDESMLQPPTIRPRMEAGFDFGISAPTAILKGHINTLMDGTLDIWIVDEFYRQEADITMVAQWMKEQGLFWAYADPAVRIRGASGESPEMLYAAQGIGLNPAPNDVMTKIATIHQFLIKNRLHISSRCKNLITEMQSYRWKPSPKNQNQDHKERPVKKNDHAIDSLGYLLMSIGTGIADYEPLTPGRVMATPGQQGNNFIHESHFTDKDKAMGSYIDMSELLKNSID